MIESVLLNRLTGVIKAVGTTDFGSELVGVVNELVPFDGAAIILFHPHYSPTVLHQGLPEEDSKVFRESYMKGAYLLDPFYRLAMEGRSGLFSIRDIAPPGFFSSSYFKQYFSPAGIIDEVNYLVQAPEGIFGLVSISRSVEMKRYSKPANARFEMLENLIEEAVVRHIELQGAPFKSILPTYRPVLMQERLDKFSRDVLTDREYEIVHLMLRGFSSKATANLLDISPATERTHRKNIYRKMDVKSHAELLADAFDFLMQDE